MDNIEETCSALQDQIALLSGSVKVHDRQLITAQHKIVDLTTRSMSNNILIAGISGDTKEEDCRSKVLDFMNTKMQMPIEEKDIHVAHCLGTKIPGKLCQIVVRLSHSAQRKVFSFTKNLKGLKNDSDDYYRVFSQHPEPIDTQKQETRQKVAEVIKYNESLADETKKIQLEFKKGVLHLNGKAEKKYINPPMVSQLMNIDADLQRKLDKINLHHSDTFSEKSSKFTGYAVRVNNVTEIKNAYLKVKQLNPDADHIMLSYILKHKTGHHDNGEHKASRCMLQIQLDRNSASTAVFIARVYGGVPIGPKRFILIEKAARDALNRLVETN